MTNEQLANEFAENGVAALQGMTHDEQVRGSALALACKYYTDTIVKDGELYREMVRDGKVLQPATYTGVIEVAFAFEQFILGRLTETADAVVRSPEEVIAESTAEVAGKKDYV